jgi:uncharacterized protein YjiS (DUF1127 family)
MGNRCEEMPDQIAEVAMRIIVSTAPAARGDLAGRSVNDNIRGALRPAAGPAASLERIRQRRALAGLSEPDLKDLGWTRGDALAELSKPFWR